MRRCVPLLLALLGCRTENDLLQKDPVEDEGADSAEPEGDCADAEVPYNGIDDDCDPATPDDDLDGDGFAQVDDCDDAGADVNPEALEECDGVDNDCDGVVDPTTAWFADDDGDGWGSTGGEDCEPPEGSVAQGGDCDDADAAVNPGATEVCDGIDNDCDGATDDTTLGYGASAECPALDCADLLAVVPGTTDGVWWIGSDGTPYEARCDMTTDGGGWTLILSLNAAGMTQYDGAEVLETRSTVGVLGDDNHLSEAFYRVAFDESYVIDATYGVPVASDAPWGGGTIGADIDAQLGGTTSAHAIWSFGSRSRLLLRSTVTTDGVLENGDMRVHFIVNTDDTADLSFPVTLDYRTNERHLVFDSDFGYAGGRVYFDPLYDVATVGVDEVFGVYVR